MTRFSFLQTRISLAIEFVALCLVVPTIIITFKLASVMIFFLWGIAFIMLILYRITPGTRGQKVWRFDQVNRQNLNPILMRFALSCVVLIGFVYIHEPHRAFTLPLENTGLWIRIMVLYPILSAIPQEFIFCTFFFARYRFLFTSQTALMLMSTVVFAYAHVLFINWVAPVLSLVAGYFFAQTYFKTRSLALVSIEHALYGNMIFTIGLGYYFYGGAVAAQ